ncbi:MAG: T9SS type A sorting domain-containing protein [Lewinellaceae bacterium]|nr:T9SS type A sorting domain-containing protein [Phaeodactylibacter sp.]MCB9036165.1 T9SS type A sorting domain-containing protein [Lewinellaceae bacterium]
MRLLQFYSRFIILAKRSLSFKSKKEYLLIMPVLFVGSMSCLAQTGGTILSNLTKQDVSCFGASDGTATLSPTGGAPPYTFLWSTGATTASISGLSAGPYGYTITDSEGNTKEDGFSILHPGPIIANASTRPITGCLPQFSGAATVSPSGGTPPYTVLWSNGQTGASIAVLARGGYGYTITDSRGCFREGGLSVLGPGPIIPQVNIDHISCFGNGDGSASLSPFGGTPPYAYQWSTGATTSSISGLQNDVYGFTITDAGGCTREGDFSIITPWPIIPNLTVENSGCFGGGSATLNPVEGTPPFTFLWSTGETSPSVSGLVAGNYSYTITDTNGCTNSGSFDVADQSERISCRIDVISAPTAGSNSGKLMAVASGGSPAYSFEWSTGQSGAVIEGLPYGVYEVSITDTEGCSTACSVSLLSAECENVTDAGMIGFDQRLCGPGNDPDPIVSLEDASGGSGALQYLWMKSAAPSIDLILWEPIPEATGPSYDPPLVFETTYFIRCVRREGCYFYLESNIVTIEVGRDAVADISGPSVLCQGQTATYTAETATSDPEISWQFSGPLFPLESSGRSIPVVAEYAGLAEIMLTVKENGCTAINLRTVTVYRDSELCGNWDQRVQSNLKARAYPNPSQDDITLELPSSYKGEIRAALYNAMGGIELQLRLSEETKTINLSLASLPSGLYFLELLQNNGRRELIKVRRL